MPWSPSDLGSAVIGWYEARDLVGVVSDGGAVGTWEDKSASNRDLTQATAGAKPSFQEFGRHGYASLRFDGGDKVTNTASSPFDGQADGYMAFVMSTVSVNNDRYVLSSPNSSGGNGIDVGLNSSGVISFMKTDTAFTGQSATLSWGDGDVYLVEHYWDLGLASNERTVVGGDEQSNTASQSGATVAAAQGEFNVGDFGAGFSAGYIGDLYAVLLVNRPLTTDELEDWRIYCYLNWGAFTQAITVPDPDPSSESDYSDLKLSHDADLYWRLSEGSVGAYDMSGNGRHGTYRGAGSTAAGAIENDSNLATVFSGQNYVERPDETFLDNLFAGSYSIEAWFMTTATTNKRLCGKFNDSVNDSALGLIILNVDGAVYFYSGGEADNDAAFTDEDGYNDGEWHHVVAQRDTSTMTPTLNLYVDGELRKTRSEAVTPAANNKLLQVGWDGSGLRPDERWVGRIDEFVLYDSILTADEVRTEYCTGRPSRCPAWVVGAVAF